MTELSPRFALPLLQAGQAQKEVSHNEAIVALELLGQPIAETIGDDLPPADPAAGASWIVGTAPGGGWAGHPGAMACFTPGGWRFFEAIEGMSAYVRATGLIARYRAGAWVVGEAHVATVSIGGDRVLGPRRPAISGASGGATIDAEARAAIDAVLAALRSHGLIAT